MSNRTLVCKNCGHDLIGHDPFPKIHCHCGCTNYQECSKEIGKATKHITNPTDKQIAEAVVDKQLKIARWNLEIVEEYLRSEPCHSNYWNVEKKKAEEALEEIKQFLQCDSQN